MRTSVSLAGLVLGLCLAGPARAQNSIPFGPWPWFSGPLQWHTVDTRNSAAPIARPMVVNNRPSPFTSLFPKVFRLNNQVPTGTSTFPTPAQMQQAAPGYFRPFQIYRPQTWKITQ